MAALEKLFEKESVSDFAKRVGCSHATLYRVINGTVQCAPDLALRIEEASGGKVKAEHIAAIRVAKLKELAAAGGQE